MHHVLPDLLHSGKNHLVTAFSFCNFTLWMPSALDARGRRPVRPAPLHATAC